MESGEYRMGGGQFLAELARRACSESRVTKGIAISLAILLAAMAVLAVFQDIRWGIIALMLVCLIIPMVMALLYFNLAFSPGVFFNTLSHKLSAEDGVLNISIRLKPARRMQTEKTEEPGTEEPGTEESEYRSLEIPLSRLGGCQVGLLSVIVDMEYPSAGDSGWIYIPQSAFPMPGDFQTFIQRITKHDHTEREAQ